MLQKLCQPHRQLRQSQRRVPAQQPRLCTPRCHWGGVAKRKVSSEKGERAQKQTYWRKIIKKQCASRPPRAGSWGRGLSAVSPWHCGGHQPASSGPMPVA